MKKSMKTQLTKERIIAAALQEFAKKGYQAFVTNELCKNHRISKGILYHNFANKNELYLACVQVSVKKAVAIIADPDGGVPSLFDYMARRHQFFKEYPHHSRVFFEAWLAAPKDIAAEIKKEKQVFEQLNATVIHRLLSEETIKDSNSREQAKKYIQFVQQLFRSYYLSVKDDNNILELVDKYETDLQLFLKYMLYGILENKQN